MYDGKPSNWKSLKDKKIYHHLAKYMRKPIWFLDGLVPVKWTHFKYTSWKYYLPIAEAAKPLTYSRHKE